MAITVITTLTIIIPFLQAMIVLRSIKGHYSRKMRRKTKALMTMLMHYRRKYVGSWFSEVVDRFKGCSMTTPDYGRSIEWPRPPPAMAVSLFTTTPVCTL